MSAATAVRGAYHAPPHHQPAATAPQPDDDDGRATLLVTTVDIGEGRAGRIEVRAGDDPVDVARAFCARHGLPDAIVLPLAQHLEDNLAENAAAASPGGGADGEWESQSEEEEEEEEEEEQDEPAGEPDRYTPLAAGLAAGRSAAAEAAAQAAPDPSAHSEPSLGHRPGSGNSWGGAVPQQAAAAPSAAAEAAGHSTGAGRTQQPAQAAAHEEHQLTHRPACANSAHGAHYFSRPPPSSGGAGSDVSGSSDGIGGGLGYRAVGGAGLPAHNRLYADHFRKQQRLEEERRLRDLEIQLKTEQVHIAPASCKLAGHRTAGTYRNYGERLYVEGRLDAMRKEQLAQRVKEEEVRAELETLTFKPEISKMAQQIKASEAELGPGASSAYQRLYQRGSGTTAKRQERMAAIRREQDEAEVAECSFRPRINPRSARMVEQRQQIARESGLPGYEQLYHDGERRRSKLEQLAARPPEEATFHPQVNTSSVVLRKLMEGREADGPLGGSADVAIRLLDRGRKYAEKLAAAQREVEDAPRDAATGRPLFCPKTHRAPYYERNPEGAPIGEYLYGIKAEWDEKAARVRDARERRTQQNAASTYVNTRSEKLVDRLKRERFRAVFDYLRRSDPSSLVNLLETVQDEVFMDTIDPEVRADIEFAARLLAKAIARRQAGEGLQDSATSAPSDSLRSSVSLATTAATATPPYAQSTNGEVDAAGFVALMESVVARTKGLTRQYLLPLPSGRQKFEEPSFRPAIDKRSLAMAARMRPETLPAHEALYRSAEELAAKREALRRAADAAELKECLFHPVMVAGHKAKEGRAIKLAAELTQSKRTTETSEQEGGSSQPPQPQGKQGAAAAGGCNGSGDATGNSSTQAGNGAGAALHFEVLERQINDALVRLSLSEEQVAASLRQAGGVAASGAAPTQQVPRQMLPVAQSVDANGYRLDFHALLGSPSPDSMLPLPELSPHTGGFTMAEFNPLDDDADVPAVAWDADSQEVVAHLLPADSTAAAAAAEELAGLDLHALASTDLPEHPAGATSAVPPPSSGEPVGEASSGESSGSGTPELWATPREALSSPGMSPGAALSARAT